MMNNKLNIFLIVGTFFVVFGVVVLYDILNKEPIVDYVVQFEGGNLLSYCMIEGSQYTIDTVRYKKDNPKISLVVLNDSVSKFSFLVFFNDNGINCVRHYQLSDNKTLSSSCYQKVDTLNFRDNLIINEKIKNMPEEMKINKICVKDLFPLNMFELINSNCGSVKYMKNVYEVSNSNYYTISPFVLIQISKSRVEFFISSIR